MGVCEHPQRDVQVTRARRRALHSISPQNCCSVPVTPRAWLTIILPHRMTQITHMGIKYKPVFTHSLQFSFLRACYNPSASPHAAWPPGSIVTNTTTGAQAPATYIKQFMNSKSGGNTQNSAPRCSASLPPAISVIHSSSFPDSYLLSYFWCQKLEFQTIPSQALLILQPTLLLPLRRHPSFPKTSIQTTLFKGGKLYPKSLALIWIWRMKICHIHTEKARKIHGSQRDKSQSSYNYSCR